MGVPGLFHAPGPVLQGHGARRLTDLAIAMTESPRAFPTSRHISGIALAFVFGGTAYAIDSVSGWGGLPLIAGAAVVGFGIGYAVGLFVTEVLLDLIS